MSPEVKFHLRSKLRRRRFKTSWSKQNKFMFKDECIKSGRESRSILQHLPSELVKSKLLFLFQESPQPRTPFHGVGRTVAEPDCVSTEPPISSDSLTTTLPPSVDLVLDPAAPTTLIHFRLADGTRLVSRFNTHHTVRDVRGFIDAYRPGGSKDYQLLIMGCPPKPLPDFDQTLENAGIYNCVIIQKF
ncbi:unnamed protein product [Microthlaspi erraticum]|uniref:UBX domain-containing protein n=1 Tax=Microthlaspi erraticum TaxID=1685480 RepID=A0A6D2LDD3_9BRAS|nr:unnamed protein product [Microthlaspi erraticum]CAA7043885.1 unnamed protein product [Microthlaspi erraticum]CAA7059137.1 unnamed protein product [Microthlaspi erraticum]